MGIIKHKKDFFMKITIKAGFLFVFFAFSAFFWSCTPVYTNVGSKIDKPAQIKYFTASKVSNGILLTWEPISNADSYTIFWSPNGNDSENMAFYVNVRASYYTTERYTIDAADLTPGKMHFFQIRVEKRGVSGDWSEKKGIEF
jgi:hypothetical protein